jgi:hypothetical protein
MFNGALRRQRGRLSTQEGWPTETSLTLAFGAQEPLRAKS